MKVREGEGDTCIRETTSVMVHGGYIFYPIIICWYSFVLILVIYIPLFSFLMATKQYMSQEIASCIRQQQ